MWPYAHDFGEALLKDVFAGNVNLHILCHCIRLAQVAELAVLGVWFGLGSNHFIKNSPSSETSAHHHIGCYFVALDADPGKW